MTNPYLLDNAAPVKEEITAFDLPVQGQVPLELEGRWLRNGPNPMAEIDVPEKHHWFLGTGMVHGVRIRGGKAEWYRNRTVAPDLPFGANTSVGGFAGTTWAMVEGGQPPIELDYELNTVGPNKFWETLPGPFTAHPKFDPATQELHAMCYHWPDLVDHVQYIVIGADGRVKKVQDVPVPEMPMMHDMSLTHTYAVVYDTPVTVSIEAVMEGYNFPFRWNPDHEARVGLLPKSGGPEDIIWCSAPQRALFHPMNAYDTDDGKVVLDLCTYDRLFHDDVMGPGDVPAVLDRWVVDPSTGTVASETISDRPQEFPRHNPAFGLKPYRFGYTSETQFGESEPHGKTFKVDMTTGDVVEHDFGSGRGGAEPVFVQREGATAEDDGWILSVVFDSGSNSSELHILDAGDFMAPAVAVISLPQRVPYGFHGDWVPDTRVAPAS